MGVRFGGSSEVSVVTSHSGSTTDSSGGSVIIDCEFPSSADVGVTACTQVLVPNITFVLGVMDISAAS